MVGFVHKVCGSSSILLMADGAFSHSLTISVIGLVTVGLQLLNTFLISKRKKDINEK